MRPQQQQQQQIQAHGAAQRRPDQLRSCNTPQDESKDHAGLAPPYKRDNWLCSRCGWSDFVGRQWCKQCDNRALGHIVTSGGFEVSLLCSMRHSEPKALPVVAIMAPQLMPPPQQAAADAPTAPVAYAASSA